MKNSKWFWKYVSSHMNEQWSNIMSLFISGTSKNACSPFALLFSYFSEAHSSTSIESPYTDWRSALCFLSYGFSCTELYNLVWISDTSASEHNTAQTFCLLIFIIYEFWLPASLHSNVGILLGNLLSPLASSWFKCTSFPGSCFADLVSQSCL